MRNTLIAALATTALLGVTACSDGQTSQTGNGQDASATQAADNQNNGQDEGDDQDEFAFGDTYDGPLRTTVSAPEEFTTSDYAQPEGGADAWKVTVTYENTLDEPYPVALLGVDGYSNNQKNSDVFDSAQGVGNAMETGDVAPGTSAEVVYGFTGEPGADRKLVISSMDGSTQVTFTGGQS